MKRIVSAVLVAAMVFALCINPVGALFWGCFGPFAPIWNPCKGGKVVTITIPAGQLRGDVNADGVINGEDVELLRLWIENRSFAVLAATEAADVTGDGTVNIFDLARLRIVAENTPDKLGGLGDLTGAWTTNPDYDTEEAQFYVDIDLPGISRSNGVSLRVATGDPYIVDVARTSTGVRVYAKNIPLEPVSYAAKTNTSGGAGIEWYEQLITDRQQTDVMRWESLEALGFANMSADERAEWMSGPKGCYTVADLNRVGRAVRYIADQFAGYGYTVSVTAKTDWATTDVPTTEQLAAYIADVAAVRGVIPVLRTTPAAPRDAYGLTWREANDIEQILTDVEYLLHNVADTWYYSGDLYAGEV